MQALDRESLRRGQGRQRRWQHQQQHQQQQDNKRGRNLRPAAAVLQDYQAEEFELIEQVGQLGFERRSQVTCLGENDRELGIRGCMGVPMY